MKAWITWVKKRHPDKTQDEIRFIITQEIGIISIVLNSFLGIMKLVGGIWVRSVSIRADGFNNLSDALGNTGIIIFTRESRKRPDKKHPFGYERWDPISTLILAMIIGFFGYQVLMESLQSFTNPNPEIFNLGVIALLIVSMGLKTFMSWAYFQASRILDSSILKAYGVDARNDVISTLFVLLSTLTVHYLKLNIDPFTGLVMAAIIFYSAFDLIRSVVSRLLGEAADPEIVEKLKNMLVSDGSIVNAHDIKIHDYGPSQIYATAHVEMLDLNQSLMEAHNVVDQIERRVDDEMGINLVIHIDPIDIPDDETAWLRARIGKILHKIDEQWIMTDFRHEIRDEGHLVYFDLEIPFDQDFTAEQAANLIRQHLDSEEDYIFRIKIEHF